MKNEYEKKQLVKCGDEYLTEEELDEYNRDLEEAEAAIERGEFVTHEEVMKQFETWKERMLQRLSGQLVP